MDQKTVKRILKAYEKIDREARHREECAKSFREVPSEARKYAQEAEQLRGVKKAILNCVNELPIDEREMVWRHWIKGERWEQIRWECYYSESYCQILGRRGVEALRKAFSACPEIVEFSARYTYL